jgi:tetratricopeptide (TPR) repeat protein
MKKKIVITLGVIIGVCIVVFGLLWYYQGQGILKIFTNASDRQMAKILKIDESKFVAAQGMTDEQFQGQIKKLYEQKALVQKSPNDPQVWFDFGYYKEFLNDHAGAVLAWDKTLELQPSHFVAAANLGNIYQYFLKDYAKAEQYYLQSLQYRQDFTTAYQGLMDLYRFNWKEQQGKYEPLVLLAIQKDTSNAGAYYVALVEFFASKKDFVKAKEYLATVRSVKPDAVKDLLDTYPELKK